jgi:hypothetical protein
MVLKYINKNNVNKNKKARFQSTLKTGFKKFPGSVLLSHPVQRDCPGSTIGAEGPN